jgi:hypothetical protein
VDDDVMVVGVESPDASGHRHLLGGGLGVLLAEVPVQREVVAEARDEFAAVESAFGAEFAAVERGRDLAVLALVAPLIVHLGLLHLEVQVEAPAGGVLEDDPPLVEFAAVVVEFFVAGNEGPHVVAVAAGVVREEGEGVHALRREVVERADQSLALVVFPRGVPLLPVADVGLP